MKITKNQLKQIIKEELAGVLREDELSTAQRPPEKMPTTRRLLTPDEWDAYAADWGETRQKYHDDPSTRPQGAAKYIAKGGHALGKAASGLDSAFRTLTGIPNAMRDAREVMQRATLGGIQASRQNDAQIMADKRLESGEWTEEQAGQFVDAVTITMQGTVEGHVIDSSTTPDAYTMPALPGEEARRK